MSAWGDARDQIALAAMKSMLVVPGVLRTGLDLDVLAEDAYRMADAMLRRRVVPAQEGSDG